MNKYNFLKLLRKYLKGTATAQEHDFIVSYYNLFEHEPDVVALLNDKQKNSLKEEMKGAIWLNITKAEQPALRPAKSVRLWTPVLSAAAVLLALLAAGILFNINFSPKQNAETISVFNNQYTIRRIQLPDGSTVILGAGSKVHFSSSFVSMAKRDVYLEGTAFFDVVHRPSRPFTVYSGKVRTTVLGTAFSVEALPWYKEITVTVRRGRVAVADAQKMQGVIIPDQQIRYNKMTAVSVQKTVDAAHYDAWKGNSLVFDDVTVAEATDVIGKKFKVKILFSDQLVNTKRFTATLSNDDSLEGMLRSICEFNKAVFSYDKTKAVVLITSKPAQKRMKLL
jgi:transmembrane sensor